MMRVRMLAVGLLTLLAVACADEGQPVSGTVSADNIAQLLTASEVSDGGRDGLEVESVVLNLLERASIVEINNIEMIEAWSGVDYSETVDGSRMVLTVVDHVDAVAANARFDRLTEELTLVESEQMIGERFAGLAPHLMGIHTIVLFLAGDKTVLMTSTITPTDLLPLVDSEELVELSRLVDLRIVP